MSKSQSRTLEIAFSKYDANVSHGDVANSCAVIEAIIGASGANGLEHCFKLGEDAPTATALYVLVRSIKNKWPWLKTTNVEKDGLQVSVPLEKEKTFTDLVGKKTLQRLVAQDFENLDTNLEGILGEKTFNQYGKKVLTLLIDVRIKSIGEPTDNALPQNMVAGRIVEGRYDVRESGTKMSVFDSGNAYTTGIVAAQYVGRNAVMEGESRNTSTVVARGYRGDAAAHLAERSHGELIRVRIIGGQLSRAFERQFKPRTTIWDVCTELRTQEQLSSNVQVNITREGRNLSEGLTLAQAEMDGSTVNWKAIIEQ